MNNLIECKTRFESLSIQEQLELQGIQQDYVEKIREGVINSNKAQIPFVGNFDEEVFRLQERLSKWRYLRGEHVSSFEWTILSSLVVMSITLIYQIRQDTLFYQLVTIVVSCSLLLCLLAIRDYDLRRPRENARFILFTQKLSHIFNKPPFIPREIVNAFTTKTFPFGESSLRTRDENGSYVIETVQFPFNPYRFLSFLTMIIVVGLVMFTLLSKYNP